MKIKYDLNLKQNIKDHRTDIFLLGSTLICFGIFGYGSLKYKELSGIGGPVAQMLLGEAERKSSEDTNYSLVLPPTELYNMDALWVGKKGSATLQMEYGAEIELGEKTFVILKSPFKSTKKDEDQIVVLKGSVRLKPKNFDKEKIFTPEKPQPTLPSLETNSQLNKSKQGIYPPDNVILYVRGQDKVELTFAWPEILTGYLVLENKNTTQATYVEVKGERSVKATLQQNTPYFWQVIDEKHRVLLGPFRFDVNLLTDNVPKEAAEKGKTARPIEIIWE